MVQQLFTSPYAWDGGHYGLAIELARKSKADRRRLLETIWSFPDLKGSYASYSEEPENQKRLAMIPDDGPQCYGIATLPNSRRVACGTLAVLEDDGPDWVCFFLPMGSMSTAYDVGAYPIGDCARSLLWRREVDEWLCRMAHRAFAHLPFAMALIGAEVSGELYARDISESCVPRAAPFAILYPSAGKLNYFPAAE